MTVTILASSKIELWLSSLNSVLRVLRIYGRHVSHLIHLTVLHAYPWAGALLVEPFPWTRESIPADLCQLAEQ